MAQRPVAGKGCLSRLAPLVIALVLAGCAGQSTDGGSPSSAISSTSSSIAGQWVTVQRGDTLGTIASRAGVPLARLQRFNPGVDSQRMAVGQRLLVPSQQERAPSGGPYRYQIRSGDTFSAIARRFGSTAQRIQAANPGVSATNLRVGQLVQVPLSGKAASTASRASAAASTSSASARLPDPGSVPSSARNWSWPLDEYRIVRRYGPDSHGTLQPMLLATDAGAQAKAAAAGQVRFADSMRQLGNVVIVHHSDNLQSVYALCDRLLVKNGQNVQPGTPLCVVGKHSSSGRYDLLFDIRHGGKPINPTSVLK
ncbi:LysM peptidoglycan-binding domain-containing protein [Halomonas binhaiensis]|uniref:LysM peptidoglycan-binding domain-containing protein n=1 Tax=Halomonas binhaiensis TaxID=2562282 RepID=A0A5C1NDX6_9GAMM|nr:LysM peptidoglycan-binding domain-containing protein [Halomonas binhaiensis]QEM81892.1 LysM peptidoglycan-binding domain-containing protein [Halomonas binhaiensis]